MKLIKSILHHFIPCVCPACGEIAGSEYEFCRRCMEKLEMISGTVCSSCGGELDTILEICSKCLREKPCSWEHAIAVLKMKGMTSLLIQKFKYSGGIECTRQFASLAYDALKESGREYDAIVPVPIHWLKYLSRGYNQTELIAGQLSKLSGISVKNCLTKTRYTKSQTMLTGKKRRENLDGVFRIANRAYIKDMKLLLIDDVFTTGSTLRSAASALLEGGVGSVDIIVLARR